MVFTKCFQKYEVIRFKLISKKKYKAFQKKKRIKEHFYWYSPWEHKKKDDLGK